MELLNTKPRRTSTNVCFFCNNNYTSYSYFRLPSSTNSKELERRNEWLKVLKLSEPVPKEARICSKHFAEECINLSKDNRRFLKRNAIPNKNIEICPVPEKKIRKDRGFKCFYCGKSGGGDDYCYFKFPEDPVIFKKWIEFCECAAEEILPHTRLCSDHFAPSSIIGSMEFHKRRELRTDAVPSIKEKISINAQSIQSTKIHIHQEVEMASSVVNSEQPLTPTSTICIPHREERTSANNSVLELSLTPTTSTLVIPQRLNKMRTPHFATPRRAKSCLIVARDIISRKNRQIKSLKMSLGRLKKKVASLSELVKHLKKQNKISEGARIKLMECTPNAIDGILRRINMGEKEKYSPELRTFALTLKYYSSRAYRYVRKVFKNLLPAPSTIRKWFQVVDGSPGLTRESLNLITQRAGDVRIPVNLVIDEMSIHRQLLYKNSKQFGQVNLGSNIFLEDGNAPDNVPEATNAFVFMAVSLNAGWKVPIAYFLIDGLVAEERANLVNIALELLHAAKADVYSLTFDGAHVNIAMAQLLGANFSYGHPKFAPWFNHPVTKEKVLIMPDPSHALKLARNALAESVYLIDGESNKIRWDYIRALSEEQEKIGLHIGNKLTKKHIAYSDNIMNVSLAAQTLSESVSTALTYAAEQKWKGFEQCEGTAKFCIMLNNAFDILNSRSKFSKGKALRQAISEQNVTLLETEAKAIKEYIQQLQVCVEKKVTKKQKKQDSISVTQLTYANVPLISSGRKTGFLGFIIALHNIFKLYKMLKLNGQTYLLSYKISQDHLESFFSAIRSFGGHNNNPNCYQFENAYRSLLVHNEVRCSESSNVKSDDIPILHSSSASSKPSEVPYDVSINYIIPKRKSKKQTGNVDDDVFEPNTINEDAENI